MSTESMSEQTFSDHFHNILNEFSWLRRAHGDLERENEDLRAENADLRAGRGRWPKVEDAAKAEPEIVTAETIRASEVWSTWRDSRDKGTWQWEGDDRFCYHPDNGDASRLFTPENAVRRYGPLARSTAEPRGDYGTPPRLTVHKLNVAPDGSKLYAKPFRGVFRKLDGTWVNRQGALRTPEYILHEYPNATLTYPERGNHE